jgi:2-hydroxychromene-2-carboxylate isomerase
VAALVSNLGLDLQECLSAIGSEVYKERLKLVTAGAIKMGVCGSLFIFIGEEPFWGHDKLDMISDWLQLNGW